MVVVFALFPDGAFSSAMFFPPSPFRDVVQPALQIVCRIPARQSESTRPACRGRERPHELFGRLKAEKVGSLHPISYFVHGVFSCSACRFLCRTKDFASLQGEEVASEKV